MNLTKEEISRLHSWKEGDLGPIDISRPDEPPEPVLPKVCLGIVSRLMHKAKTARGQLLRARQAINLILKERFHEH